jgi:DNA-damage-inducible protein J
MEITSVTIRIDENLKKQAEILFEDMGMNMTTAFTIFAYFGRIRTPIPVTSGQRFGNIRTA